MEKEPKITVNIYKDGEPTGKTEVLDLSVLQNQEEFEKSLQQQDGEFD